VSEYPSRDALVATAGETIAQGSRSFAAASRLFDRTTRHRAWLLYAWCRACDDIADGQTLGHGMVQVDDGPARLARVRGLTEAVLAGDRVGDPSFDGLRFVVAETGLPRWMIDDHLAGFALDAEGWRPRSEADLLRYCYHVAGAVGCMMAVVMGVAPDDHSTLDRASDLGLAFQLANIARDIDEDARARRSYLPEEWEGMSRAEAGRRLAAMALDYEASARFGTPALAFRSAWAVLAAARIYGGIARKVAERGEAAWERRVTTSGGEKLGAIAASFVEAASRARRYPPTPRPPELWTRPR
jgi:15-cis-phytoene synthase